ncbi:MAG: hypothetical protein KDK70_41235, partial [Myxococcales bacterium]|nr:hypothetical protein [Myxococcales bacterium]
MLERGLTWYELQELYADKLRTSLTITFPFVATHNHFVLDRGGKVFKQTAPIIKLSEAATEDDHLALLAYLNSSTACFWMKQVFFEKGATSDRGVLQADEDKFRYEFDGTKLKDLPLPEMAKLQALAPLARIITNAASATTEGDYELALGAMDVLEAWRRLDEKASADRRLCVAIQEELDWRIYGIFHLTSDVSVVHPDPESLEGYEAEERPFLAESPSALPEGILRRRAEAIARSQHLTMLEKSQFKRRWYRSQGKFNAEAVTTNTWKRSAYVQHTMSAVEELLHEAPQALSSIRASMEKNRARLEPVHLSLGSPGGEWTDDLSVLIEADSVPFLSALRFTEAGIRKHEEWQAVWDAQRREDRGETTKPPLPPPKYAQVDFVTDAYYRIRGKLDVPKDRFISYPHCESRESPSPLYGWAGWNHEQRARALATLYWSRKTEEGWLVPKPDDPPNTPDLTP